MSKWWRSFLKYSIAYKNKSKQNFYNKSKLLESSVLILYTLTFFQLRILMARGGVGADNLLFKLASNPIGSQPEAVVLSSIPSSQFPHALDLRNSADL